VPLITIGEFTQTQFAYINLGRRKLDLHELAENRIVFIGRHLYTSRSQDGYSIDDIVTQIRSALSADAVAQIQKSMSCTQNPNPRDDGYGNAVRDRAIFEMTARKPRAELYSVIPKGDAKKPKEKGRP
jgi:hypothetical protein